MDSRHRRFCAMLKIAPIETFLESFNKAGVHYAVCRTRRG